jgi:heme/copper-type cytochrome/quinol oxidase subunit 1
MKEVKRIILIIAVLLVLTPLIDFYLLNEELGKISFGLFSLGILIHSINLIYLGVQGIKNKKKSI